MSLHNCRYSAFEASRDGLVIIEQTLIALDDWRCRECQCGRKVDWHRQHDIKTGIHGDKWDADLHTVTDKCTSFGSIEFVGFGKETGKNNAMVSTQ